MAAASAAQAAPGVAALSAYLAPILDDVKARLPTAHVAVATSGGADSMALLLLTKPWCDARGITLTALTVDHGMRPEAAQEARQVAAWCAARRIAHHTLAPVGDATIANLQTRARTIRYAALGAWCEAHGVALLLVAHHADDQAETVALQQHRGDSPPSRAGMALVSPRGSIHAVRPLLGVRKAALIDYLRAQDQPWIDDPSNASDAYARNRLRRTLDDATILALWHAAQKQGRQRHADDLARNAWLQHHAQADGTLDLTAWRTLPDTMRSDVLSRVIQSVGGKPFRPRRHETDRLVAQLLAAPQGTATLGHCLLRWAADDRLRILREPLDKQASALHITRETPSKPLASAPFWWFTYPLFS